MTHPNLSYMTIDTYPGGRHHSKHMTISIIIVAVFQFELNPVSPLFCSRRLHCHEAVDEPPFSQKTPFQDTSKPKVGRETDNEDNPVAWSIGHGAEW